MNAKFHNVGKNSEGNINRNVRNGLVGVENENEPEKCILTNADYIECVQNDG